MLGWVVGCSSTGMAVGSISVVVDTSLDEGVSTTGAGLVVASS